MRYSLYLPPSPGDKFITRINTANLAAGTTLTLVEVVHRDGIKYIRVEEVDTLIDARKVKRAPADPGVW